jgi:putative transposase
MMEVKFGKSIEITKQLKTSAATTIAQWIGSSTVIYNQKTLAAKREYQQWVANGKDAESKPIANQQVAYLTNEFEFLKEVPCQIRRNAGSKWFEAVTAAKKGIREQPQVKPKHKKRNCYVTQELFDIQAIDDASCIVHLKSDGTKKNKGSYLCGVVMPFSKDKAGSAFYLSRKGSRFWLSMSYDRELNILTEQETKELVLSCTSEQLQDLTTGFDLGVKKQVASSDGIFYHYTDSEVEKLKKLEKKKQKYQRQYARRARANDRKAGTEKRPRTNGENKLSQKIAKVDEKRTNIKRNRSHHISKQIADSVQLVGVFEDLKLNNMVRKAKAKQDPETGQWLRNGAAAKSGLNKAILNVNLGQIRDFCQYKLRSQGKLFLKINPYCTSQECHLCGFTHKDNRKTQAEFKCLSCDHSENADTQASKTIKKRGIEYIRTEAFLKGKTVRKISARRKQGARTSVFR